MSMSSITSLVASMEQGGPALEKFLQVSLIKIFSFLVKQPVCWSSQTSSHAIFLPYVCFIWSSPFISSKACILWKQCLGKRHTHFIFLVWLWLHLLSFPLIVIARMTRSQIQIINPTPFRLAVGWPILPMNVGRRAKGGKEYGLNNTMFLLKFCDSLRIFCL